MGFFLHVCHHMMVGFFIHVCHYITLRMPRRCDWGLVLLGIRERPRYNENEYARRKKVEWRVGSEVMGIEDERDRLRTGKERGKDGERHCAKAP